MADARQDTYVSNAAEELLWPGVSQGVANEVRELASGGLDVALSPLDLGGHYQLPPERQLAVTEAIDYWAQVPDFANVLLNPEANPSGAAWRGIAKRAVALHPFYNADINRPSDGISEDFLDEPLFAGGRSARDLTLGEHGADRGDVIIKKYEAFLAAGSMWSNTDDRGLSAGDYIAGSVDRIADVTRARALIEMTLEHVHARPDNYRDREFVSASLACGAAEPVFWLAKELEREGIDVGKLHLVDGDPIALAASMSRARAHEVGDKVTMHRRNLVATPIDSYIAPGSVDIVDLIGLFEYLDNVKVSEALLKRAKSSNVFADLLKFLPDQMKLQYEMPGNLLADAAKIVRPGGMIVFGNMLNSRPQQEWFSGIWPPLKQRSIEQVVDMVEAAGFSRDQLKIRVPENEGVYALYAIEIPRDGTIPAVSQTQRALGKIVTRRMPEY